MYSIEKGKGRLNKIKDLFCIEPLYSIYYKKRIYIYFSGAPCYIFIIPLRRKSCKITIVKLAK